MRHKKNAYTIVVGIPEAKPPGRPRRMRRWDSHNRMDPKETGRVGTRQILLASAVPLGTL
jgi:hypothetical protein